MPSVLLCVSNDFIFIIFYRMLGRAIGFVRALSPLLNCAGLGTGLILDSRGGGVGFIMLLKY